MGGHTKRLGLASAVTLAALIICAAAAGRRASADGAVMSIDPPSQNVATDAASFTVNIKINGAANVGSWEFAVAYDTARFELADVVEGPFLTSDGQPTGCFRSADTAHLVAVAKTALAIDTAAVVQYGCGIHLEVGKYAGPSGAGSIATLTFKPKQAGVGNLVFLKRELSDPSEATLNILSTDGVVQIGATGGALQPTPTANPANLTPVGQPTPEIDPFIHGSSQPGSSRTPSSAANRSDTPQSQATAPSGTIATDPTVYGPPAPDGSVLSAGAAPASSEATSALAGSGGAGSAANSNFPRAGYGPQPSEPDPAWRRAELALAVLGAILIALGAHKRWRQA